ncbi:GNAT family N-acetyltransferase [Streptomyces sp. NPDC059740]|uniref:GNAT family N-acetyltransferase n=1 Tax=Streptomyces sp. NPDC059740 TaxID=3346926 RepID=UPI003669CFFF
MAITLCTLTDDEWDPWYDTLEVAFGETMALGERSHDRALIEVERSFGMREGGAWVATAGAHSFGLTVPGGALLPTAAVTFVCVLPTHRRRGLLRAMMRHQLDDVHARGEAVAALTASEPAIYGRFGYGAATQTASLALDTWRVPLTPPPAAADVRLRLVDPVAALDVCGELATRLLPSRPGMLARGPAWRQVPVFDPEHRRAGASPLRCVLAEAGGEVVGYARYAVRPARDEAGHTGTVQVREVTAAGPAGYGALWRFLFGVDLTTRVEVADRPLDDPLLLMVDDVRSCRVTVREKLFVRLVDVGAALAARAYAAPVDVVLAVADDFCPWNARRWRLSADGGGAVCEPSDAPADLSLTARDLAAAYLGGTSLRSLAGAGRVVQERAGALAAASAAFASQTVPWTPFSF